MEQETSQQQTPAAPVPPTPHDPSFEQKRKMIGVLSYFNVLVIFAYTMANNDERLLFHVRQGAVLCLIELAALVVGWMTFMIVAPLLMLAQIFFLILSIIGIANVLTGKDKELPFIGHLAKHLPF